VGGGEDTGVFLTGREKIAGNLVGGSKWMPYNEDNKGKAGKE